MFINEKTNGKIMYKQFYSRSLKMSFRPKFSRSFKNILITVSVSVLIIVGIMNADLEPNLSHMDVKLYTGGKDW